MPTFHDAGAYRLLPHQVPDCPTNNQWVDVLSWCVAVMGTQDEDLGFAASLLSHAVDRGGLTDKQAKYAKRLLDRVRALWMANALPCQSGRALTPPLPSTLQAMETEGHA